MGTSLSDMGAYGGGDTITVGIPEPPSFPSEFALPHAYPNPFNPSTTISYVLPAQSDIRIEIYNIIGQKIETIVDGNQTAGYHSIIWNASVLPSGIYFARLEAGGRSENVKMALLK